MPPGEMEVRWCVYTDPGWKGAAHPQTEACHSHHCCSLSMTMGVRSECTVGCIHDIRMARCLLLNTSGTMHPLRNALQYSRLLTPWQNSRELRMPAVCSTGVHHPVGAGKTLRESR